MWRYCVVGSAIVLAIYYFIDVHSGRVVLKFSTSDVKFSMSNESFRDR